MNTALKIQPAFSALQVIRPSQIDERATEMVQMLKWDDLPDRLIELIENDLIGFYNELEGTYCTNCEGVRNRRRTVCYWVDNYLNGVCSYDTAYKMLKINF